MPLPPPEWSEAELEAARLAATEAFRVERMQEPLECYLEVFDDRQGVMEELLESTVDLATLDDNALAIVTDPRFLEALRYLAGPFVSEDDLKVVAEVKSLSRKALQADPSLARRLVDTVRLGLDRRRFPWVAEGREPTEAERDAAVLASAALIATQRAATGRRSASKIAQERAICDALQASRFKEVPARRIKTHFDAPRPGEFCQESLVGTRKADIVVGLWDRRIMPIEAKVSNSATNSIKRLNNDAAVKAVTWRREFGDLAIVPTAVLSGVYKLKHLVQAQERGLAIFWAHELTALTDWIGRARPTGR